MNYKMNELIEVRDNDTQDWYLRKAYGMTFDGRIITSETDGYTGYAWKHHRKIKPPELVPWTLEDVKPGMQLRRKEWHRGHWAIPSEADNEGVVIGSYGYVSYTQLLEDWETLDGKPCGKEPL